MVFYLRGGFKGRCVAYARLSELLRGCSSVLLYSFRGVCYARGVLGVGARKIISCSGLVVCSVKTLDLKTLSYATI